MSNKQFSQKEQEVLSTYFLNKMSNHLKPIPLHAGKFFDGELEIDVALPFRRIFDFEFEYSEATSNIYIAKNDVFSMKKTIQFAKEFINNFTTVVKINGEYLGEIIKETGYMLRLINNPFVYMDSLRDGGRFLIQCDYLNYKRNSERYKEFRFVQEGSYFRNYEKNMKKSLALVTGEMELTKWEFQEAPTFFLGKPKTTAYSYVTLTETNQYGHMVDTDLIRYRFKQGTATQTDLEHVATLVKERALATGKDIVIENLNFKDTKAKTVSKRGKKYNDMLHSLAYRKFIDIMDSVCYRNCIWLRKVNPAWTSWIAKQKYCQKMKLNIHTGASFVIARRGQGYTEKV